MKSLSLVSFFLCSMFGALTSLTPWFAVPCAVFGLVWAYERFLQQKVDDKIMVDLHEAKAEHLRAREEYVRACAQIAILEDHVDQLKASVSMRFGAK